MFPISRRNISHEYNITENYHLVAIVATDANFSIDSYEEEKNKVKPFCKRSIAYRSFEVSEKAV